MESESELYADKIEEDWWDDSIDARWLADLASLQFQAVARVTFPDDQRFWSVLQSEWNNEKRSATRWHSVTFDDN